MELVSFVAEQANSLGMEQGASEVRSTTSTWELAAYAA